MAKILKIPTFCDKSGDLSVIEKIIGFNIRRVYYLYNLNSISRAKHKHKKNKQFLVCLHGKLRLKIIKNKKIKYFTLNNPNSGILLEPSDWHEIFAKKKKSIALVLASEFYNKKDYINEF